MTNLQRVFDTLLSMYYSTFPNTEIVSVNVRITNDLNQTHAELRPDISEEIIKNNYQSDYNGRMVPPKDINGPFYILLNNQRIAEYTNDGSMTWVGTFAHEYTHVVDYYQMANLEGLDSYCPLERDSRFFLFNYWSEYHARKNGYKFLRVFFESTGNFPPKDDQIRDILDSEAPIHKERFLYDYSLGSPNEKLYLTMQYLGRFSVWIDLFPNEFSVNKVLEYFPNANWMLNLLTFLRQHESIDEIYGHFYEMQKVLSENWTLK